MASWQTIARENIQNARRASEEIGGERTACSRAYYAAFSALTAYLASTPAPASYTGNQTTPPHRRVRTLVATYGDPAWKVDVERLFVQLYRLRIDADYRSSIAISRQDAKSSLKAARRVMEYLGVR